MIGVVSYVDNVSGGVLSAFGVLVSCKSGQADFRPVIRSLEGRLEPLEGFRVEAGDVLVLRWRYNPAYQEAQQLLLNRTQGWDVTGVMYDQPQQAEVTRIGLFSAGSLDHDRPHGLVGAVKVPLHGVRLDGDPAHDERSAQATDLIRRRVLFRASEFARDRPRFRVLYEEAPEEAHR